MYYLSQLLNLNDTINLTKKSLLKISVGNTIIIMQYNHFKWKINAAIQTIEGRLEVILKIIYINIKSNMLPQEKVSTSKCTISDVLVSRSILVEWRHSEHSDEILVIKTLAR